MSATQVFLKHKRALQLILPVTTVLVGVMAVLSPAAAAFITEPVDGVVGTHSSLVVDSAGNLHLSFYDGDTVALVYGVQIGGIWSFEIVDSGDDVGLFTSLALDSTGDPHITYYDSILGAPKYAERIGGGGWSIDVIGPEDVGAGTYTSLALDSNDQPHVVYLGEPLDENIKYATRNGSTWIIEQIDSGGIPNTALALDSFDRPHVAYVNFMGGPTDELRHAVKDNGVWSINTVESVASGTDGEVSLALTENDLARISYQWQGELKYAALDQFGFWNTEVVESPGGSAQFTSLALDRDGVARIAYQVFDVGFGELKFAAQNDWGYWAIEQVEAGSPQTGTFVSLALGPDGNPYIAYTNPSAFELKLATGTLLNMWYLDVNMGRTGQSISTTVFGASVSAGPPSLVQLQGPGVVISGSAATTGPGMLDLDFDLTGAPLGIYDLIVANAVGSDTLRFAFEVHTETVDLIRATTQRSIERFPSYSKSAPDRIAFTSSRAGGAEIFIKDPASPDIGSATRITLEGDVEDADWSPDGNQIIFFDNSALGLAVVDLTTGIVDPQPIGGAPRRPSWSPRGDQYAYDNGGVFTAPLNDDNFFTVTTPSVGTLHSDPTWSPDGQRIAFVFNNTEAIGSGIATVSATEGDAGGIQVILPEDGFSNIDPSWSPDGKWIAFASDRSGSFDIWVMNSNGQGGLIQITEDFANDIEPTWSRDGSRLAFISTRNEVEDVYLAANLPLQQDTDGDLVPDIVDACPTEAPALGQFDRDFDGCPDPTSSFRQVRFWSSDQFPVFYETDTQGDPSITDGSDFSEMATAFSNWTTLGGTEIAGGDDGTRAGPSTVVAGDGRNSVSFSDPAGFEFNTIAITFSSVALGDTVIDGRWYRPGEIVDADVAFNTRDYDFSTTSFPGPAGSFDLQTVFLHEGGHLLGLSHSVIEAATMFAKVQSGLGQRTLEEDDNVVAQLGYFDPAGLPPNLAVQGQVVRGEDGVTPVQGVAVLAIGASGDTLQNTFSAVDGFYRFYNIGEDFRVYIAPMDGGPAVNGLQADAINQQLDSVHEEDVLPEFWDEAAESDSDFETTGFLISLTTVPVIGADVITNIDTSPPQVQFTNPDTFDVGVPVSTAISVKFDEKFKLTSINSTSFAVINTFNGVGAAGEAGRLQLDSLLVFTPNNPLDYSTPYQIRIGPGIEDIFGNPMTTPVFVDFITGPQPPLALVNASPAELPVGATLVLTGTGFSLTAADNQIRFTGDIVATAFAATLEQLYVVVPQGAQSGNVAVSVTGGPDSNGLPITILPPKPLPTGNLLGQVALGGNPRKLDVLPGGAWAYVATDAGVTAVGALPTSDDFLVTEEVAVGGSSSGVVAMPDGIRALAVTTNPPALHEIDADSNSVSFNSVLNSASLVGPPLGIAVVPGGAHVLIAYSDRVVLHQAQSGPAFGLEERQWTDGVTFAGNLAVSVDAGEAYATTSDGQVAVLSFTPAEEIVGYFPAGLDPQEIAAQLDANGFLGVDGMATLREYGKRGPVLNTTLGSGGFTGLTISPEGSYAYAANRILNRLEVVDLFSAPPRFISFFTTGTDPRDVATGSAGRYVYVVTASTDQIEVYDTETGPVVTTVSPRSGGPGTLITVTGSGFDPVPASNQVSLGGVTITPDSVASDGSSLLVRQSPTVSSGPISVSINGAASNTAPYKFVDRGDVGQFSQFGVLYETTLGTISDLVLSPDDRWLVGIRFDGSMFVLSADPSRADFLQPIQEMTPVQTGLTFDGAMVVTPDGKKLYVLDRAASTVAIFDISTSATNPLTRNGSVQDGVGDAMVEGDELAVTPDGGRLLVRSEGQAAVWEVDPETDLLLNTGPGDAIGSGETPTSMTVDPRGHILYVGFNTGGAGPVVLGYDLDPASPNYRQVVYLASVGALGTGDPTRLVPAPNGNSLYGLVSSVAGISLQYTAFQLGIDPGDAGFQTVLANNNVILDVEPILLPNHSGSVVYVLDRNGPGGINAYDDGLGFLASGPGGARYAGQKAILISKDDARIYVPDGGLLVVDVSTITSQQFSSGTGQVAVVNQTLPAPLVIQTNSTQTGILLAEGAPVLFQADPAGGDFGFGDQMAVAAASANGFAGASYTAGSSVGQELVTVTTSFGSLQTTVEVVADTSAAPPQALAVSPITPPETPGVNTKVAVDFSKAVNPNTVTATTFMVRPVGGSTLAGLFTFANGQKRAVFNPQDPLLNGASYEVELTTGIQDNSGNPLDIVTPAVFTFITQVLPTLALHAVDPPTAQEGNPVVLSGTGFATSGNQVLFGSVAATPFSEDPGAIGVVVPVGAGSDIRVVANGVTSNSIPFTVIPSSVTPVNEVTELVDVPSSGQGIAVLPNGTYAYMTSSGAGTVVPINLTTALAEAAIATGLHPFAAATSPTSDRVYVSNFFSNNVSVVDADPSHTTTWHTVIANIPVDGVNPSGIAAHPDNRSLYVMNYGDSTLSILDVDSTSTTYNKARANINLGTRGGTVGVSPDGFTVVAGVSFGILLLDPTDGSARESINLGTGGRSVAVTPDNAFAVVLGEDDTLWLVDIRPGVPVGDRARTSINLGTKGGTVGVSPDGAHVYITTENNTVVVYQIVVLTGNAAVEDPSVVGGQYQFQLVDTVEVGENPIGLAVDQQTGTLLVVNSGDKTVTFLNVTGISTGPVIAEVDADPNTLNLVSKGKFITAHLQFPVFIDPAELDLSTVQLDSTVNADTTKFSLLDKNGDGILEAVIKFPRAEVIENVPEGDDVTLVFTGIVDGREFEGEDMITLKRPKLQRPRSGVVLAAGHPVELLWEPSSAGAADHLDIYWSMDNGEIWDTVVVGTPDDSSYVWGVPDVESDQCLLALVAHDKKGEITGISRMGSPFVIATTQTGVANVPPAMFALHPAFPNPFRAQAQIRFDLPEATPVTLRVFGLDGGLVRTLADNAAYPAGRHELRWDGRNEQGRRVGGGVYFLRIQTKGETAVNRIVRLQR